MEVISLCPFPAECLLWEAEAGQPSLTVIVKITLRLVHNGESAVAGVQAPILGDEPWDDSPMASLFRPSDRAPLKQATDLLLVGHAYAPGGRPVEHIVATMKIGDYTKSVAVTAPRQWTRGPTGLMPGPPLPFEKMPLRYERGALSQDNPAGVDVSAPPLEGAPIGPSLAAVSPASFPCFGPVSPAWRPRRRLLGDAGRFWALGFEGPGKAPAEPVPPALDFRYFNSAPPDQQTGLLRQRAEIELINLDPDRPTLRTRLPPLRPQVFRATGGRGRGVEIPMRCDTLWIDSDEGYACLVFRGLTDVPSKDPRAIGTIYVVADPQGRRVRFEQVEQARREGVPIEATAPGAKDELAMRHDAVRGAGEPSGNGAQAAEKADKDDTRAIGPGGSEQRPRAVMPFEGGDDVAAPDREAELARTRANRAATPFGPDGFAGTGQMPAVDLDRDTTYTGHDDEDDESFEEDEFDSKATSPAMSPPDFGDEELPPLPAPPPVTEETDASEPLTAPPPPLPAVEASTRLEPATSPPAVKPGATTPPPPLRTGAGALPFPPALSRPAITPAPPPLRSGSGSLPMPPSPSRPAITPPPPPLRGLGGPLLPLGAPPAPPPLGVALPPLGAPLPPLTPPSAPPPSTPAAGPPSSRLPPMPRPPAPAPAASSVEPQDVSIATYGAVSAELSIRRGERAKVLEGHQLNEPTWARVHSHWTAEMGRETARGESKLLAQFDAAYVDMLCKLRTPIGVPEYAAILVAIERGAVDKQLALLKLSLSDLMRVQRVWTRRMADDPELGRTLSKAVEEARGAAEKPAGSA